MEIARRESNPVGPFPRSVWAALIPLFALSIVLGALSDGCYHDDDLTHYLIARWAQWYPSYLLHIWGRPGLTVPLAAVSWIGDRFVGWHAARVLSSLATAVGAIIAARLAWKMKIGPPWLVVLLCYAQPLATVVSYTTLTENWTALYLIAATSLLLAGRRWSSSVVFSLALVTRHEAVIFIPLWWAAVMTQAWPLRSRIKAALLCLWAPVVHNLVFFAALREWPVHIFSQPRGSTEFLPAGPLSYLPAALYAMTPFILAMAVAGLRDFCRRDRWLIVGIPTLFLLVHMLIKWQGLFASGGYGRFMAAVAPFTAILAVSGFVKLIKEPRALSWICVFGVILIGWLGLESEKWGGLVSVSDAGKLMNLRLFMIALLLVALAAAGASRLQFRALPRLAAAVFGGVSVAQCVAVVRPLLLRPEHRQAVSVANWIRQSDPDAPVFAAHAWVVFELGLVESPRAHKGPRLLASMPAGTLVVWDSKYCENDFHRLYRPVLNGQLGCISIKKFDGAYPQGPIQYEILRKGSAAQIWASDEMSYPADLGARSQPLSGIFYIREP